MPADIAAFDLLLLKYLPRNGCGIKMRSYIQRDEVPEFFVLYSNSIFEFKLDSRSNLHNPQMIG